MFRAIQEVKYYTGSSVIFTQFSSVQFYTGSSVVYSHLVNCLGLLGVNTKLNWLKILYFVEDLSML